MSKIKVTDLTKEQLHEWVARAQGWELVVTSEDREFLGCGDWRKDGKFLHIQSSYSPTSDTQAGKAQAFDLQVKYHIDIERYFNEENKLMIKAICFNQEPIDEIYPIGSTETGRACANDLAMVICRAVVVSKFGEEVKIDDEMDN